jgi:hypothetical protein
MAVVYVWSETAAQHAHSKDFISSSSSLMSLGRAARALWGACTDTSPNQPDWPDQVSKIAPHHGLMGRALFGLKSSRTFGRPACVPFLCTYTSWEHLGRLPSPDRPHPQISETGWCPSRVNHRRDLTMANRPVWSAHVEHGKRIIHFGHRQQFLCFAV